MRMKQNHRDIQRQLQNVAVCLTPLTTSKLRLRFSGFCKNYIRSENTHHVKHILRESSLAVPGSEIGHRNLIVQWTPLFPG